LENLQQLATFSGLTPTNENLQKEISTIKRERAYAF